MVNVKEIPLRDETNISNVAQKGMRVNTNPTEVMAVFARNRVEKIVYECIRGQAKAKIIKYYVGSPVIDTSRFTRLEFDVVLTILVAWHYLQRFPNVAGCGCGYLCKFIPVCRHRLLKESESGE